MGKREEITKRMKIILEKIGTMAELQDQALWK